MNGFIPTPDFSAGIVNIPAIVVALLVTGLLMVGIGCAMVGVAIALGG